ncbi:similar to An02g10960 [Aspergillus luchuensis]|uniref:Similar to An02g10960 n=1 Tax=Aspergillus kawachii TaxID=1069201 RepID=A0A146FD50_ASPKA|nr:similar to An02g10960 [Aspergillus luchuensis]
MDISSLNLTSSQYSQTPPVIGDIGRITQRQYGIAVGIFFALAALSFLGRIFIRLFTRRRLYLDDAFLSFAFTTLLIGTVLGFLRAYTIYFQMAALEGNVDALLFLASHLEEHAKDYGFNIAFIVLLWTTVFSVKWCYLAFFHPLLVGMSRWFILYYRCTVGLSFISWILSAFVAPIVPCPYTGMKAISKCFPSLPVPNSTVLAMVWLPPILDALTDLMSLGCFLCLSIFMCTCSIIRTAGTWYHGLLDYPWQVFWLHLEGCIGVTMGSITVYRSTLIGSNEVSTAFKKYFTRIKDAVLGLSSGTAEGPPAEENKTQTRQIRLPSIPQATITGLRTWFGLSRKDPAASNDGSGLTSFNSDIDYHTLLKAPKAVANQHQ